MSIEVIENLALASIESLYAVGQSSVGAAHAISDPLSGRYNIHHGLAVGILLPFVIDVNYDYSKEKYDCVKCMLEQTLNKVFDSLPNALLTYYDEIGFEKNTLQKEIAPQLFQNDMDALIVESYNSDMVGNPRDLTNVLIGDILSKAYGVQ